MLLLHAQIIRVYFTSTLVLPERSQGGGQHELNVKQLIGRKKYAYTMHGWQDGKVYNHGLVRQIRIRFLRYFDTAAVTLTKFHVFPRY